LFELQTHGEKDFYQWFGLNWKMIFTNGSANQQ
jgi:hypothetical protein